MKHYHVLQGLRGCYMPDDNCCVKTLSEARSIARCSARMAREDGELVRGSAGAGFYSVGEYNCIEITECDLLDCDTGD